MLQLMKKLALAAASASAVLTSLPGTTVAQDLSVEDVREIAKEAYIYGFPMVDNYRIQFAYFQDPTNPEYKAPRNVLFNIPRVFTPEDKAIQTPNSDTPYSWIGMDLRAEPLVFTVPAIESNRYWSLQLIDLYTHNFDYLGSRTTGNGGGSFAIAGPNWQGDLPEGITKVIRSETDILSAQFRTQLFSPDDLENVKAIQAAVHRPAAVGLPGATCTPGRSGHRLCDTAKPRCAEDLARVLFHPELPAAVCPHTPLRGRSAGPLCADRRGVRA